MAYGQTGSGKTYTMMGPKEDPGVNVRAIRELLRICGEREQVSYTLKVSHVKLSNILCSKNMGKGSTHS